MSLNLSSSPFHVQKQDTRAEVARCAARTLGHPFLLCNQVGGNDDLIFDGRSLAAWPNGDVIQAPAWKEGVMLVDTVNRTGLFLTLDNDSIECNIIEGDPAINDRSLELLEAVTTGLRD